MQLLNLALLAFTTSIIAAQSPTISTSQNSVKESQTRTMTLALASNASPTRQEKEALSSVTCPGPLCCQYFDCSAATGTAKSEARGRWGDFVLSIQTAGVEVLGFLVGFGEGREDTRLRQETQAGPRAVTCLPDSYMLQGYVHIPSRYCICTDMVKLRLLQQMNRKRMIDDIIMCPYIAPPYSIQLSMFVLS
ncbi:hypothetical protein BDZ45DRAFT_698644 [Acephala macrosclerotiorum]|nr:hypothetical protein BDZ45DRAFT_698644 [Acephala macrosclerotiorum]